jgi:hypothetical protein
MINTSSTAERQTIWSLRCDQNMNWKEVIIKVHTGFRFPNILNEWVNMDLYTTILYHIVIYTAVHCNALMVNCNPKTWTNRY